MTSAVAEGDLTRSVNVEASGEVAELKDNINAMVESLRETTRANQEQDWLKTNLARVSGLMQGHRDLPVVAELIMDELVPLVSAQYGAFYLAEDGEDGPELRLVGSYGYPDDSGRPTRIAFGKTLVGQAARSRAPSWWTSCRRTTSPSPPGSDRWCRPRWCCCRSWSRARCSA